MQESQLQRSARLRPLAEVLAKRHDFSMPYYAEYPGGRENWAQPFLIVNQHYLDDDDGYGDTRKGGSSEWAGSAKDAASRLREKLRYTGWSKLVIYDVERQEECKFEFSVQVKYRAVTELSASVGEGCFDNAPTLGGNAI